MTLNRVVITNNHLRDKGTKTSHGGGIYVGGGERHDPSMSTTAQ